MSSPRSTEVLRSVGVSLANFEWWQVGDACVKRIWHTLEIGFAFSGEIAHDDRG